MSFLIITVAALILAGEIALLSKRKNSVRKAAKASLSGIAALFAVNSLAFFTGVSVPVNYITLGYSFLLGVPGTILLLILKLIT